MTLVSKSLFYNALINWTKPVSSFLEKNVYNLESVVILHEILGICWSIESVIYQVRELLKVGGNLKQFELVEDRVIEIVLYQLMSYCNKKVVQIRLETRYFYF